MTMRTSILSTLLFFVAGVGCAGNVQQQIVRDEGSHTRTHSGTGWTVDLPVGWDVSSGDTTHSKFVSSFGSDSNQIVMLSIMNVPWKGTTLSLAQNVYVSSYKAGFRVEQLSLHERDHVLIGEMVLVNPAGDIITFESFTASHGVGVIAICGGYEGYRYRVAGECKRVGDAVRFHK